MNFKQQIKKFRRNAKAVSPVIATIILVAMSIVMAIAVAYWALGIGNSFTKFEKVQYTSTYPVTNDNSTWTIFMNVKNTGTATATINNVFLNGQPFSSYGTGDETPTINPAQSTSGVIATVNPGESQTITVNLKDSVGTWVSGMNVQVDVMTAAGNSYPATVLLP